MYTYFFLVFKKSLDELDYMIGELKKGGKTGYENKRTGCCLYSAYDKGYGTTNYIADIIRQTVGRELHLIEKKRRGIHEVYEIR